jgi:hypothetical protein
MTFNVHQKDTERGIPQDLTGPTPSERFLLFRDLTFVCIILFHLASAILAIPTLVVAPTPDTHAPLIVILFTGVLAPLLALVGSRDHIRTSKFTSAMWFEFGWTLVIMVIDLTIAVAYSTIQDASKVMVGFTFVETITMMIYILALGGLILLQHHRFPELSVWKHSVQSVQWLRSSVFIDPSNPPAPPRLCVTMGEGKGEPIIPPWDHHYDDMHEIKLDSNSPIYPENSYVSAHPFWQAQVQRQVVAEEDMAYVVQRYGLNVEANKMKPHFSKPAGSGHVKRPSIRGLEISRPVPVASTVRRANTLTTLSSEFPLRYKHQHTGSMDTWDRPIRRGPPTALRVKIPSTASGIDVPEDVLSLSAPVPAARITHPKPVTRSLGLASRTLVGTSRPKASATRAYVNTSKPLPSPPPYDGSDLSLPSSGPSQGSHKVVMAMAHRVMISASKVRPLMVSTPTAAETPIDFDDEKILA